MVRGTRSALKLSKAFPATHLAIGLDSAGEQANLTVDNIGFSSRPPRWSLSQVLPHETRTVAWTPGQEGFTAEPVARAAAVQAHLSSVAASG